MATERIGEIIGRINDYQTTIVAAVEEQTATTNEMNRNVAAAAEGATRITSQIGAVAGEAGSTSNGVQEASRAADQVAALAASLQQTVGTFTFRC